ncbi:MAG: glycosyltransferase [Hyphomonadaceae bacterium]
MSDLVGSSTSAEPASARLAVVIGTYNRLDQIKRCIDSIRRETCTPTMIYVTDAGSTDGTEEYLRGAAAQISPPSWSAASWGAKAYNDVFKTIAPFTAWLSDDNEIGIAAWTVLWIFWRRTAASA